MGPLIEVFGDVLEENEAQLEDEIERTLLMGAFSNLRTELTMTAGDIPRLRALLTRLIETQGGIM